RLRTEAAQQAREHAEAQVRARTAELEVAQQEIVTRLAMAAEYRDDVTGKHTWRVGYVAGRLGAALGLTPAQTEVLRSAARLHDVGKIGIPDHILLKPGKFTDEEYEAMKLHTVRGAQMLSGSQSALLRMAEEIALTHHERWDGRGYPHGLSGEEIPLVGRVVSVADVFDALTHERPYKRAWTTGEALAEIGRGSGTQFDPRVVEAALRLMGEASFFEEMERDLDERPEQLGPRVEHR
ncbi:HD-GYP domain-containing protein, partial [Deinococcus pimensis]|uniref:HD-GYP domain-containing protein n=1 Tax=Deinococcus pimensis TaxID=309888 RepID=UPI00069349B2